MTRKGKDGRFIAGVDRHIISLDEMIQIISITELAKMCRRSRRTIYTYLNNGMSKIDIFYRYCDIDIKHIKISKTYIDNCSGKYKRLERLLNEMGVTRQ